MKAKYIYHKEDKSLRCKVKYEESFNGISLQLQKKNCLLGTVWHDTGRGVDVKFKDNIDDVDRSNRLDRYLSLTRDLKTYQTREDALSSAIDELFEKYISGKRNKKEEKQKVKNLYDKL